MRIQNRQEMAERFTSSENTQVKAGKSFFEKAKSAMVEANKNMKNGWKEFKNSGKADKLVGYVSAGCAVIGAGTFLYDAVSNPEIFNASSNVVREASEVWEAMVGGLTVVPASIYAIKKYIDGSNKAEEHNEQKLINKKLAEQARG